MAGVVACLTGIYGKLKSTLTEHIVTMGGVVQEGLVRSDRFDAPVKCTTVLVSERTDGPKTEEDWRAAQASPSTPLPAPHSGGHCRARSAAPNQLEIQHHCPHPRLPPSRAGW